MKRDHLIQIAKQHGWGRGKKTPASSLQKIRKELEEYFDTPEGREALARAPRSMLYTTDGSNEIMAHETTKDLAVKLLLQEFE